MRYIIIHLSNIIQFAALCVLMVVLDEYFNLPRFLGWIVIVIPSYRILAETIETIYAYDRARRMAAKRKRDEKILDA